MYGLIMNQFVNALIKFNCVSLNLLTQDRYLRLKVCVCVCTLYILLYFCFVIEWKMYFIHYLLFFSKKGAK